MRRVIGSKSDYPVYLKAAVALERHGYVAIVNSTATGVTMDTDASYSQIRKAVLTQNG